MSVVSWCWIDLDYAAALYIAAQVHLAGGREADCIPVTQWYMRHAKRYVAERDVLRLCADARCCQGDEAAFSVRMPH